MFCVFGTAARSLPTPQTYGFHLAAGAVTEVEVLPDGNTKLKRWRTLGRISHETALVMPDNRTVYSTDDSMNGGGCRACWCACITLVCA